MPCVAPLLYHSSVVFVTALALPGSLQRDYGELQTALFREYGVVGARSLPAMIPVAVFHDPAGHTESINAAALQAVCTADPARARAAESLFPPEPARLPVLQPNRYTAREHALYVLYSPEHELLELGRAAESIGVAAGLTPLAHELPLAPGVLLALGTPEQLSALQASLPSPPAAAVRQAWWQLLRIVPRGEIAAPRSGSGAGSARPFPWWYAIEYDILAERRIPKAK